MFELTRAKCNKLQSLPVTVTMIMNNLPVGYFRDLQIIKEVGLDIEAGNFTPNKDIHHTHEGSIGNLCNDKIQALMDDVVSGFQFQKMEEAVKKLLNNP